MNITWDEWAVPTITGEHDLEVAYGMGYAQAVAHATLVLELYGKARGNAAALWGADFVEEDTFTAQLGLREVTTTWFEAQAPETMARIAAFCDGFNAACAEDEGRGGARRGLLPVVPRDVLAHTVRTFVRFNQIDPKQLAFDPAAFYGTTQKLAGSNAWAVSARRSSTGNAMVMINPHLSYLLDYHLFVELRTVSPGRDFHGITLVGFPWQSMGYNPHVGWAHTVNPIRNLSVHEVTITDGTYEFAGERRELETREHKIEVAGQASIAVLERRSVHGPIVVAPDGVEVAVRMSGVLDHPATGSLESWWQLTLAESVEELLATQDRLPLPMFNLVAADSAGSIAALFCGTPWKRTQGSLEDSQRRLPGEDPAWLFDEVHPASAMPRVVNPESGWVQNCNETPWFFTSPLLDEADFPAAVAPSHGQLNDMRVIASHDWLRQQETISPQQLLDLKFSTRAFVADICLDQLLEYAAAIEGLQPAVAVLQGWDRNAGADSRGYPLFWMWSALCIGQIGPWELYAPVEKPDDVPAGLKSPEAGVALLGVAVMALAAAGVALDANLGEIASLGTDDAGVPVPAAGGSQLVGALKCLELMPMATGLTPGLGDTWVSLVELRPDGKTHADSLLLYGNTTEPGAPASKSQYPLWAANQLRPPG